MCLYFLPVLVSVDMIAWLLLKLNDSSKWSSIWLRVYIFHSETGVASRQKRACPSVKSSFNNVIFNRQIQSTVCKHLLVATSFPVDKFHKAFLGFSRRVWPSCHWRVCSALKLLDVNSNWNKLDQTNITIKLNKEFYLTTSDNIWKAQVWSSQMWRDLWELLKWGCASNLSIVSKLALSSSCRTKTK